MILCVGVLATLYLIMRGRAKRTKLDPLARAPNLSVAQQRQIERDISSLMVEMLQTARQMTAQLDTRATRLEVLIRDADQRLSALKSAGGTPVVVHQPKLEPVAVEAVTPVQVRAEEEQETPPDPRHAEIYSMADQGRSPYEIARSLNRPNGEIELILALRHD